MPGLSTVVAGSPEMMIVEANFVNFDTRRVPPDKLFFRITFRGKREDTEEGSPTRSGAHFGELIHFNLYKSKKSVPEPPHYFVLFELYRADVRLGRITFDMRELEVKNVQTYRGMLRIVNSATYNEYMLSFNIHLPPTHFEYMVPCTHSGDIAVTRIQVIDRNLSFTKGPVAGRHFSTVHMGEWGTKLVAVKRVGGSDISVDNYSSRLSREICDWCAINSRHIIPLWGITMMNDAGQLATGSSNCWGLVSPWYVNGNLGQFLARKDPQLTHKRARLNLLLQVAKGLQDLHERSPPIIHGNLKPDNVVIDNQNQARLTDFGLSRQAGNEEIDSGCTWRYAAVEIINNQSQTPYAVSPNQDAWSFGCVLFEIMSGRQPWFQYENSRLLRMALFQGTADSEASRHLAPGVARLVEWCMSPNAKHRLVAKAIVKETRKLEQSYALP